MANEINGLPPSHVQPKDSGQAKAKHNDASGQSGTQDSQRSGGDQVSLTDTGMRLSQLEQRFSDAPVVDDQRVEGIKQAVHTGSFQVDPGRVADRMMGLERAMSASGRS